MLAFVLLGSNADSRRRLAEAADRLSALPQTRLMAASAPYLNPSHDARVPGDFLNRVLVLDTELSLSDLQSRIKELETLLDRRPGDKERGVVAADIDLLQYDGQCLRYAEGDVPDCVATGLRELRYAYEGGAIVLRPLSFVGIIPARYASTRFPAKPLAMLGGKMVIQRVYEQVGKELEHVYVATDSEQIRAAVEGFGGRVVMTSDQHKSGTDRCREAAEKIGGDYDVVVNIQGDEPFIQPSQLQIIKRIFADNPHTQIATLVKPFAASDGIEALENPNSPKVVLNDRHEALYFSRSVIPYLRNVDKSDWPAQHTFYKHIGLYAFARKVLDEVTRLPQSTLELAESLEQLRWLQHGYTISVGVTDVETIGIDTPADLQRAEQFLKERGEGS